MILGRAQPVHPSPHTLQLIADTLDIPPTQIAEYALWHARHQLDEREIGITQALRNLRKLSRPEYDEGSR